MATQTTNLHLVKPAYADVADIAVLNGNSDIIDGVIGGVTMGTTANTLTGAIAEHEQDITGINDSIGTVPSGSTVEGQITSANQAISNVNNKLFKKIDAATNLNNITDDGIYLLDWVYDGVSYNRPVSAGGRLVHSTSTSGTSTGKQQTYLTYAGDFYVRGYVNGAWSNWQQLALESETYYKPGDTFVTSGVQCPFRSLADMSAIVFKFALDRPIRANGLNISFTSDSFTYSSYNLGKIASGETAGNKSVASHYVQFSVPTENAISTNQASGIAELNATITFT